MSTGRVDGKSVIITGAAKGIGRACAEVFAHEGARLVLNDVDEPGLRGTAASLGDGVEVVTVVGDVSVEEDARGIVTAAIESFGAVNSLVANAGIIPLSGIEQASAEEWDEVMAVDGRGMFLTCKFVASGLTKHLAVELAPGKIRVNAVAPGTIRTVDGGYLAR